MCCYNLVLRTVRWRLAGVERGSRPSQGICNRHCDRVRPTEHAPRGRFRLLERRRGLENFVERGGGVLAERPWARPRAAFAPS